MQFEFKHNINVCNELLFLLSDWWKLKNPLKWFNPQFVSQTPILVSGR